MKELSVLEKAKAYDEAIKKVNDYYEGKTKLYSNVDKTLDYLFPELKESEDEKIRKIIKQSLKSYFEGKLSIGTNDVDYAMCLSWLKKQGEQKPAEWNREDEQNLNACLGYIPDEFLRRWLTDIIHVKYDKPADKVEPKFKVGDTIKAKSFTCMEHKPFHITKIEDGCYWDGEGTILIGNQNEFELVEQKPAWSEEDEKMMQYVIGSIDTNISDSNFKNIRIWFEAVKDRVLQYGL